MEICVICIPLCIYLSGGQRCLWGVSWGIGSTWGRVIVSRWGTTPQWNRLEPELGVNWIPLTPVGRVARSSCQVDSCCGVGRVVCVGGRGLPWSMPDWILILEMHCMNGVVQDCGISSAYALEIPQSCMTWIITSNFTRLSIIWGWIVYMGAQHRKCKRSALMVPYSAEVVLTLLCWRWNIQWWHNHYSGCW